MHEDPIRLPLPTSHDGFIAGSWRYGAGAAQALLRAGQLDEMELHLVQVLLGDGRRPFTALGREHIAAELLRRIDGRDPTHLRYRVLR
jgi:hypothetical protein